MLIKMVQVLKEMRGGTASLKEIYLNPNHIISISEDTKTQEVLINEVKNLGLLEGVAFTKVIIQEGSSSKTITVVGDPKEIYGKLKQRQVLRG